MPKGGVSSDVHHGVNSVPLLRRSRRPRTATFLSSILLLLVIDTHAEAVLYCTNCATSGLQFWDNALYVQSWQDRVACTPASTPLSAFSSHMRKIWDQNGEWHSCRARRIALLRGMRALETCAVTHPGLKSGLNPTNAHSSTKTRMRRQRSDRGQEEWLTHTHPFSPRLTYNIQRCVSPFLSLAPSAVCTVHWPTRVRT